MLNPCQALHNRLMNATIFTLKLVGNLRYVNPNITDDEKEQ